MPNSNKYIEDYKKLNYDTIKILSPKGTRERLKREAEKRGLSVNAFINRIISDVLSPDPDSSGPDEKPKQQ